MLDSAKYSRINMLFVNTDDMWTKPEMFSFYMSKGQMAKFVYAPAQWVDWFHDMNEQYKQANHLTK